VSDLEPFAWLVLVTAAVGLAAVLSNRLTERLKVPAPALVLIAAAVIVKVVPDVHAPPERTAERLVTVALLCILFEGGMHIGWSRFRDAAAPIAVVGVAGTFLTVAGAAGFLHLAIGLGWYPALLTATAVAPTDPAVVFSVLGRREVAGRSGTILEGESGANDPVGIALMASLIDAGGLSGGGAAHVAGEFALQLGVGAAIGLVGGRALLWFMRRVPLPSEGLYPLRTLASALVLYGVTTLLHGSGFLALFIAGVVIGDARAPYKREIEHFHAALASLGEIVAFVALGLTVDIADLAHPDVWLPGLALGVTLAVLIRPLLVGPCLLGAGLRHNEQAFVLFAGLLGAPRARAPRARRILPLLAPTSAAAVLIHVDDEQKRNQLLKPQDQAGHAEVRTHCRWFGACSIAHNDGASVRPTRTDTSTYSAIMTILDVSRRRWWLTERNRPMSAASTVWRYQQLPGLLDVLRCSRMDLPGPGNLGLLTDPWAESAWEHGLVTGETEHRHGDERVG